jgi:Protein of unknown function (DUF3352)
MLAAMSSMPPIVPEPPPPPAAVDPGTAAPTPASELPPRPALRRRLVVGGLTFLVVAAAAAGGITAFRFLRGAGEQLSSLVPDDTAAYVTLFLDPSGGQKLAANGLLAKFPKVATPSQLDATINRALDDSLRTSGLGHNDIRPWLGSQIAVVVAPPGGAAHEPAYASLLSTGDGDETIAALHKYQRSASGRQRSWTTRQHGGISVYVAQGRGSRDLTAYAVVNGAFVISNSTQEADEIIDTAQGHHRGITAASDYTTALSRLPSDKLALVYVDLPRLKGLGAGLPLGSVSNLTGSLDGYQGAGFAVTAQPDGVAIDGVVDFDRSKLSASSRAVVGVAPDLNKALNFVPQHAYGVYALTGLPQILRSLLETLRSSGSPGAGFGDFLAPLLSHLSGDAAVEADQPAGQSVPGGALLLAADSDASARQLLTTVVEGICGGTGVCSLGHATTQVYRGVTLSTLPLSAEVGFEGFAPSWAVQDRMAILATSPEELKAVLDAHATTALPGAHRFTAVMQHADATNNALLYMDLGAIESAVRGALPPDQRTHYDKEVAPYLEHFSALVLSTANGADRSTLRWFIQVQ